MTDSKGDSVATPTIHQRLPRADVTSFGNAFVCLARGALVIYAFLLLFAMHLPEKYLDPPMPQRYWSVYEDLVLDKAFHFMAYAGLTFLVLAVAATAKSAGRANRIARRNWITPAVLMFVGIWGLVDELTQPLTGRSFQWGDWLADIAGAAAAIVFVGGFVWAVRCRPAK